MSETPTKRRWYQFKQKSAPVFLTLAVCGIMWAIFTWSCSKPRPLFNYENTEEKRSLFCTEWTEIPPACDGGTWCFIDPNLNILVVVVTDDPRSRLDSRLIATDSRATLFPDTAYEVKVGREPNLLILRLPDGREKRFPLKKDGAVALFDYQSRNILQDIAQRYPADDNGKSLRSFIACRKVKQEKMP